MSSRSSRIFTTRRELQNTARAYRPCYFVEHSALSLYVICARLLAGSFDSSIDLFRFRSTQLTCPRRRTKAAVRPTCSIRYPRDHSINPRFVGSLHACIFFMAVALIATNVILIMAGLSTGIAYAVSHGSKHSVCLWSSYLQFTYCGAYWLLIAILLIVAYAGASNEGLFAPVSENPPGAQ